MPRAWIWIQLAVGWVPVWALFTILIVMAHDAPAADAALVAARLVVSAALLGVVVFRVTARWPWPHPFRLRFLACTWPPRPAFSVAWLLLNSAIEGVLRGQLVLTVGPGLTAMIVTAPVLRDDRGRGLFAARGTALGTRRALEAKSRLAALRAQLHPPFPLQRRCTRGAADPVDPRAAGARLGNAGRPAAGHIDEPRDVVTLADEWALVRRYLDIEQLRLGERLVVREDIAAEAMACELPSFALQTLVENAVRHAAAPRVTPTTIAISAAARIRGLVLSVADDGRDGSRGGEGCGHGVARLRERARVALWRSREPRSFRAGGAGRHRAPPGAAFEAAR